MKRQLIAGLLALTVSFGAQATNLFDHPVSANDPALVAATSQLANMEALQGNFEQRKQLSGLPMPLVSTGRFVYARNTGVYWHTQAPYDTALLIGPNRLLQQQDGGAWEPLGGANNNANAAAMFGELFLALLSVDVAALGKQFDLFWLPSDEATPGWRVGLTPQDGPLARSLQRIVIGGSDQVERVWLTDQYGDRTEIDLKTGGSPDEATVNQTFKPLQ